MNLSLGKLKKWLPASLTRQRLNDYPNPAVFWRLVIIIFLVGFVIVLLVHWWLFIGFRTSEIGENNPNLDSRKIINEEQLAKVNAKLQEKQSEFSRYQTTKPAIIDPSL